MNYRSAWTKVVLLALFASAAVAYSGRALGSAGQAVKLNGYVIDSSCAFVKGLAKPISQECAVACAKAGSPLAILAKDGTIYLPISDATPAKGQNERLMEYAGKMVSVTGKVYKKGGSRAIVIETIEAASAGK